MLRHFPRRSHGSVGTSGEEAFHSPAACQSSKSGVPDCGRCSPAAHSCPGGTRRVTRKSMSRWPARWRETATPSHKRKGRLPSLRAPSGPKMLSKGFRLQRDPWKLAMGNPWEGKIRTRPLLICQSRPSCQAHHRLSGCRPSFCWRRSRRSRSLGSSRRALRLGCSVRDTDATPTTWSERPHQDVVEKRPSPKHFRPFLLPKGCRQVAQDPRMNHDQIQLLSITQPLIGGRRCLF